ncbi:MAG: hypothetical protein K6L81_13030 [Agarilytica sp.]
MHESILEYKGKRYLYISILLTLLCVGIYASQSNMHPANGGTWQGYTLGGIATALIVWLLALGIRKRQYSSRLAATSGWVSAHVYLGAALLIIATLHCAAQFGINIHTLAYLLMSIVILSGFFGLYAYMRYPKIAAENRLEKSRSALFHELSELNTSVRNISKKCDGEIQRIIESALERTSIGGSVISQLFALDFSQLVKYDEKNGQSASTLVANHDQQLVIDLIAEKLPRARKQGQPAILQQILSILCRRQALLRRIRKDIQLQSLMKVWLLFHIPLSVALFFALGIHILSVFYYW